MCSILATFFIVLLYVCTCVTELCSPTWVFYIHNLKKKIHYLKSDIRRMQSEVSCLHFMLWNLSKKREQTTGEERALSRGWPITAHHLLWCLWSMTCNYNLNIRSAPKGQRTYMSVVASWQKPSQVWYLNWSVQEKCPKWAVNVKSASRKKVGVFYRLQSQCFAKGQLAHLGTVWKSPVSAQLWQTGEYE